MFPECKKVSSPRHWLVGPGFLLLVFASGCSDVGFVGANQVEVQKNSSADYQAGVTGPQCAIDNMLHPSVDSMSFRVMVVNKNLRLDIPGRYDELPVPSGDGYVFADVTLPLNANSEVSVDVFDPKDSASEPFRCSTLIYDLVLTGSGFLSLSGEEAVPETAAFKLSWSNLFPGESLRLIRSASTFSSDLIIDCDDGSTQQVSGVIDKNQESNGLELGQQDFNCTVRYLRPYGVQSVRYRNQKIAWELLRGDRIAGTVERLVTFDMIAPTANDISGTQGTDPLPPLSDPDSCQPMTGLFGQAFSHVCDGQQSLLGPEASNNGGSPTQSCAAATRCGQSGG